MGNILEVKGISISFGGLKAVNDVSFNVEEGKVTGIIGPNGAGKSTLFNLITSVLRPDKGEVIFQGQNIVGKEPHEIATLGVGRTFQDAALFPDSTALENVMYSKFGGIAPTFGKTITKSYFHSDVLGSEMEGAIDTLKFVGLEDSIYSVARNLDHGRQGLLQLAIALATKPKLLMVDEPLRGMNPTEKDEVTDLLLKVKEQGISVIIIEHDVRSVMKVSDNIVVISYGQKIAEGTPEVISKDETVIEAYLGSDEDDA